MNFKLNLLLVATLFFIKPIHAEWSNIFCSQTQQKERVQISFLRPSDTKYDPIILEINELIFQIATLRSIQPVSFWAHNGLFPTLKKGLFHTSIETIGRDIYQEIMIKIAVEYEYRPRKLDLDRIMLILKSLPDDDFSIFYNEISRFNACLKQISRKSIATSQGLTIEGQFDIITFI